MPDLVWLATLRRGASYHDTAGRQTVCGRFIGDVDGNGVPIRGWLVDKDEALQKYEAKPCATCHGLAERHAPKVVPSKDKTGRRPA